MRTIWNPNGNDAFSVSNNRTKKRQRKRWLIFRVSSYSSYQWETCRWNLVGMIQKLAVKVLLGTRYRLKTNWDIFCMECRIISEHLAPFPVLARGIEAYMARILSHEAIMDEQNKYATITVAKRITNLAETGSPVVIVTCKYDFMTIERMQTVKSKQRINPARGVHEFRTNVSFPILVTNF